MSDDATPIDGELMPAGTTEVPPDIAGYVDPDPLPTFADHRERGGARHLFRRRTDVDWRAVKDAYLAGCRPVQDIAKEWRITEGAIRHRARRYEWGERARPTDQLDATRAALENHALVRAIGDAVQSFQTGLPDAAADAVGMRLAIVAYHRHDIREAQSTVAQLYSDLKAAVTHREALRDLILATTSPTHTAKREALQRAVSLGTHAQAAVALASAMARLVALERQAFGIVDTSAGSGIEGALEGLPD